MTTITVTFCSDERVWIFEAFTAGDVPAAKWEVRDAGVAQDLIWAYKSYDDVGLLRTDCVAVHA